MKEHQTCTAEIHRKVIRMATPMTDLEAKLMLRQMGDEFNQTIQCLHDRDARGPIAQG